MRTAQALGIGKYSDLRGAAQRRKTKGADVQLAAIHSKLAAAGAEKTPSPQLVRAAHQFEGMMIQALLKPMTSGGALDGSDENTGSNSALSDFASQSLGQSLSEHGGMGIANRIIRDLSHAGKHPATEKSNPKSNPKIKPIGQDESFPMTQVMRKF